MAAERDTVDRLIAAYLAERIGDTFRRRASPASSNRDYLSNCRSMARMASSRCHRWTAITISTTKRRAPCSASAPGKGYQLADRVEVRLVEVAPLAGAMRFEMLTRPEASAGRPSARSTRQSAAQARR